MISPAAILLTCTGLFALAVFTACCWKAAAPPPPRGLRAVRANRNILFFKIVVAAIGLILIFAYTVSYQDGMSRSCTPSIQGRC